MFLALGFRRAAATIFPTRGPSRVGPRGAIAATGLTPVCPCSVPGLGTSSGPSLGCCSSVIVMVRPPRSHLRIGPPLLHRLSATPAAPTVAPTVAPRPVALGPGASRVPVTAAVQTRPTDAPIAPTPLAPTTATPRKPAPKTLQAIAKTRPRCAPYPARHPVARSRHLRPREPFPRACPLRRPEGGTTVEHARPRSGGPAGCDHDTARGQRPTRRGQRHPAKPTKPKPARPKPARPATVAATTSPVPATPVPPPAPPRSSAPTQCVATYVLTLGTRGDQFAAVATVRNTGGSATHSGTVTWSFAG